jgi:hypothetical protein
MIRSHTLTMGLGGLVLLALVGCSGTGHSHKSGTTTEVDIQAARDKLTPEDRALVEAQEWCAVTNERLGSMGVPHKITVKGQPVFLCCDRCEKKALADPDKTLAAVETNKKRAREK